MKMAATSYVEAPHLVGTHTPSVVRSRLADYLELTKPRIAVMALITVGVGYLMAAGIQAKPLILLHTLIGTALVAAGASAMNQWLERDIDARMSRTRNRPLPAGRLKATEVLTFALASGVVGFVYLFLLLPSTLPAWVAGLTYLIYAFVYTPLKQVSTTNTLVGALPGALPPVIGWTAGQGSLGAGALVLFAILFFWQMPHFFAIAWMYRDEYARGGLRMLPVVDPSGQLTGRTSVLFCLVLLVVGMLPALIGLAGWGYLLTVTVLGLLFLARALQFAASPSHASARRQLYASLIYLPLALMAMVIDGPVREFFYR